MNFPTFEVYNNLRRQASLPGATISDYIRAKSRYKPGGAIVLYEPPRDFVPVGEKVRTIPLPVPFCHQTQQLEHKATSGAEKDVQTDPTPVGYETTEEIELVSEVFKTALETEPLEGPDQC